MSENFYLTMIGSVGVPAAVLFFVMICINKYLPKFIALFADLNIKLDRVIDQVEKLVDKIDKGAK
ncbi:MAG: hypothetical protein NTW38_10820 [Candidatus Aminicenantes bacterium]|nr:hypothetical protein [Candidatus Aminicenantes bacterium]